MLGAGSTRGGGERVSPPQGSSRTKGEVTVPSGTQKLQTEVGLRYLPMSRNKEMAGGQWSKHRAPGHENLSRGHLSPPRPKVPPHSGAAGPPGRCGDQRAPLSLSARTRPATCLPALAHPPGPVDLSAPLTPGQDRHTHRPAAGGKKPAVPGFSPSPSRTCHQIKGASAKVTLGI